MSELMDYAQGAVPARRDERQMSKQAKEIYDRVRLSGMEADGVLALTRHIMQGVDSLDKARQALGGNEVTTVILIDLEMAAVQVVKNIQANHNDSWHL